MDDDDRIRLNQAWWDERVATHMAGGFYDVGGFLAGRSTLRPFERAEMGDVAGLRLVHLHCHFGLDTLSWAREGALVTGVDFAPSAVGEEDLTVTDSYFDPGPFLDDTSGSYADPDAQTRHNQALTWQHGLGSVITALAQAGLRIEFLHEHPYTLRARWPFMERQPDRTYHMPPDRPQVPLLYSVQATRPR